MTLDWLVWYYARALDLPFPVLRSLLTHGLPIEQIAFGNRIELHVFGQRHCPYGPAVEGADGSKAWYHNNQQHRDDGPAVEFVDGTKAWYRNDQRHRDDGPAIEYADGTTEHWRNGVQYWPNQK